MLLLDNREVKKGWEPLKETVDGLLTKHGAKIVISKRWDERKLAYEILRQKRATYYLAYLEADPGSLVELNHTLKLAAPILRSMILSCETVPEEAYEPERDFNLENREEEQTEASKKGAAKEGAAKEGAAKEGEGDAEASAEESKDAESAAEGADAEAKADEADAPAASADAGEGASSTEAPESASEEPVAEKPDAEKPDAEKPDAGETSAEKPEA